MLTWKRKLTRGAASPQSLTFRNLSALAITLTEDMLMAKAASIGDKSSPVTG